VACQRLDRGGVACTTSWNKKYILYYFVSIFAQPVGSGEDTSAANGNGPSKKSEAKKNMKTKTIWEYEQVGINGDLFTVSRVWVPVLGRVGGCS
jgi:hypothetical protein